MHQVSPLTHRSRAILEEIKAEKKRGAIISNVAGLVLRVTDHRSPRGCSTRRSKRRYDPALESSHDYRNTALTQWRREGISVDAVMRAGGWTSTQMYKRYLDMNEDDVADAFGTSQIDKRIDKRKKAAHRK